VEPLAPSVEHAAHVEADGEPGSAVRESAFDVGPVAQIAVDAEGSVVLVNQQARALFGLGLADVGRPLKELAVSDRPVELRANIEIALAERRSVVLAHESIAVAGGQVRELDVHVTPLYCGERALGATITYTDVTAQRRLQDELDASTRELESAYEELQSTAEELETTNAALQSTNEELETMNEELESTSQELETINDELRRRTLELNTARTRRAPSS
jgi:two-component system CheB/CheR fusion protein